MSDDFYRMSRIETVFADLVEGAGEDAFWDEGQLAKAMLARGLDPQDAAAADQIRGMAAEFYGTQNHRGATPTEARALPDPASWPPVDRSRDVPRQVENAMNDAIEALEDLSLHIDVTPEHMPAAVEQAMARNGISLTDDKARNRIKDTIVEYWVTQRPDRPPIAPPKSRLNSFLLPVAAASGVAAAMRPPPASADTGNLEEDIASRRRQSERGFIPRLALNVASSLDPVGVLSPINEGVERGEDLRTAASHMSERGNAAMIGGYRDALEGETEALAWIDGARNRVLQAFRPIPAEAQKPRETYRTGSDRMTNRVPPMMLRR